MTRKSYDPTLAGKVGIVTGGARGLGAACAWALCEGGAAVTITDILADVGEATAQELRAAGHKAQFVRHDVTDEAAWADVVAKTVAAFGKANVLVNNAGISQPRTIEDASLADFRRMLDINLLGPFMGMQTVIPAMKAAGGGSIINISSNSTRKIVALACIYSASKAALANLTKTSAVTLGPSGIRVNSIHPGPHATDMLLGGSKDADLPAVKALVAGTPMGRMGVPNDVGAMAAFLASDAACFITASEFFVDGGGTVV